MKIQIGIHNTGHFSSVAISVDGKIVYAIPEERLSRVKFDNQFPFRSIEAGLKICNLDWDDVDEFLIAWNPSINASERFRAGFSRWVAHPMQRLYSNVNAILPNMTAKDISGTEQLLEFDSRKPLRIKYINHHYAHIGMSYFTSGFDEAAIYIADGYGESSATVFAKAKNDSIEIIKEIKFPHSLGMFYATFTEFLGFEPEKDEWKVMGAAAYGDYTRYLDAVWKTVLNSDDGNFELDLNYFNFYNYDSNGYYSQKMVSLIGDPEALRSDEQAVFDLAAAVQYVFEDISSKLLSWLHSVTGAESICLGGGTAMNCLFNGKIESKTPFLYTYIPFAPDDVGNAVGALLWENKKHQSGLLSYHGGSFDVENITTLLDNYKIKYTKYDWETLYEIVATLLSESKIIGWFQDGSEFGQRALGNRSILADSRDARMKDIINSAVKYREAFRPFAPAIMDEFGDEYFEEYKFTPHMERILRFKERRLELLLMLMAQDGCRV